jgi:ribosome maturation factor RimP
VSAKAQAMARRIQDAAAPSADQLGLEVVEVVFIDAKRRPTVRVFVDKDGGVTLDDCAHFSRVLGEELDRLEITPGPYNLEVSSPGAERPFSTLKQYQRNLNKPVEVVLQEPIEKLSHLRGTLVEVAEDKIVVQTEEGHPVEVPMSRIKRANRVVTF